MKKIIIAVLVISAIMFSCQKEMDENSLLNPPVTNLLDSNYLDIIYEIDSIAGVNDTFGRWIYEYDNQKRVASLTEYDNYSGMIDGKDIYRYFYNGNDSLPFKTLNYNYNLVNNIWELGDSSLTMYYYNAQGRNIKDSLVTFNQNGPSQYIVKRYEYAGQNIYMEELFYLSTSSIPVISRRDTAVLDLNGNIRFSKKYAVYNNVSTLDYTSEFTYDNKPSPFKKLSNFSSLVVTPFGETFFYEMQGTNNRLRANEINAFTGNGYTEDLTGKYSYLPNGYPSRIVDEYAPDSISIVSFKYRSL
ncbi:MAG: hypothetical protein WAT19_06470 [Ferruginibacter sp.]